MYNAIQICKKVYLRNIKTENMAHTFYKKCALLIRSLRWNARPVKFVPGLFFVFSIVLELNYLYININVAV